MNYSAVENSILKGAKFLLDLQNPDGGIKFADENSHISGVWVTAEALEFFLQSKVLPMTCYEQVKDMIIFLLNCQKENGAWSVLTTTSANSTVTTGHSIYVLKLSLSGGFIEKTLESRVRQSIKKGEEWLEAIVAKRTSIAFWGAENKVSSSLNPNKDESSRMEFVFTTYYALMGLIDPPLYSEGSTVNESMIKKVYRFFCDQAEWFVNKYTSVTYIDKLEISDFAKIASTICRVINGLMLIEKDIPDVLISGLKKIVELCSQSSYMTTSITINTQKASSSAETYNNNTPFDMGMALVNLHTDANFIEEIVQEYIEHQESEGYWFLNFRSSYRWNSWTTSEALIFLEVAMKKYDDIRNTEVMIFSKKKVEEIEKQLNQTKQEYDNCIDKIKIGYDKQLEEVNNNYNRKMKSVRNHILFLTVVSCILSVLLGVNLAYTSQQISELHPTVSSILNVLIIPLIVNVIIDILKIFQSNKN